MTISERMFQIMEEQGISQYRLSKMTGISTKRSAIGGARRPIPGQIKS